MRPHFSTLANNMKSPHPTQDLRIKEIKNVVLPTELHTEFPATEKSQKLTSDTRQAIHRVLHGEDDRLIVIVGPCSIHDPKAALDYAGRLKEIIERLSDQLLIVMRVYFEKPRTSVGWKGLINDPMLDGSFHINQGLRLARKVLLDLTSMGMPTATEFLDLITPQYIADLISWGAIGARTIESQVHRELASGLSCPVGFKNGTDGTLKVAMDAIRAASLPHHFLSMSMDGKSAIFSTTGNDDGHIILRGGALPNYDRNNVRLAEEKLESYGLTANVMIDCSHANSMKQPEKQMDVAADIAGQISTGDPHIIGVMIESHINAGRQDIAPGKELLYGVSITDGCIGWDETVDVLESLAEAVTTRRKA
ncbi:MAG: 3-deoxy-7-phosphoheptulonate synthase AroG [Gammaproteobacteria bacterium]|nr:MAG: 3-deoxy-7-phosphoheptulonate synthase AroG [Gammaproteobacteria bacterium]